MNQLQMPIVYTCTSGSPIMVMILAHCFLGQTDRINWVKVVAILLLAIGIYFISNPYLALQKAVSLQI